MKKLIWKFKYYLNPQALRACTYILYDQLIADASDRVSQIPFQRPYVLLHYPSSTYFNNKKSFDHMKELTLLIDKLQSHPTTEISAFEGSTFESSIFRGSTFFTCCIHAILPNKVLSSSVDIDNGQTSIKAQHTGSRADRFKWSKERFVISNTFETYITNRPETRHIYCIDDIVTTGASMQAVSDMFNNKFGLKVKKFCIGH